MELDTPVEKLTRVGKTTASRLHRLGIMTARDLLFHFPFRYEDWSASGSIAEIKPFQNISITGLVASIKTFRSPRKRLAITEAVVEDGTGSVTVTWFNQPFLVKNLPVGTEVSLSGKVELKGKELILKSPKYEVVRQGQETKHTARILPVYPLAMNLTQKQVGFLTDLILPLADQLIDPLPESLMKSVGLIGLQDAIKAMHKPVDMREVEAAQKRLAFQEVFYLQLQSLLIREANERHKAPELKFYEDEIKDFVASLPFELTNDQRKSAWQIFLDLQENKSMNRLLQGDVGSGKTVVSAMAMYNVALNGLQSVLMAPTEVLATQHFQSFAKLFENLEIPVALLTRTQQKVVDKGEVTEVSKKELIKIIKAGDVKLVIGTHALIQKDVGFADLGLAVIDEQHRFGVKQRKVLREHSGDEKTIPHLLSMTATPIPRTLSLVFYGDLAISSLREKPANRLEIKTHLVMLDKRQEMYEFIRGEVKKGRQAYVVCPLIEESDKLGVTSVAEEEAKLKKVFPDLRIAQLHGKLSSEEKNVIMGDFKEGRIELLVATTVIEVGVDVANATLMLIEGAERFGLSQLHQIRGRVGRGKEQSYCFLFPTEGEISAVPRLERFIKCKDGFEIAELDLRMRGSGELLGRRQSGTLELQFVDVTDGNFIETVNNATKKFLKENDLEDFPELKKHIEDLNAQVHLE